MQWLLVPGKPGDLPEVLELSEVQEPGLTYRPKTGDSAFGQILVLLVRQGCVFRAITVGGGCFGVVGDSGVVTVLLGGDVMLGRGVDQILPHPGTRHRLRMRL